MTDFPSETCMIPARAKFSGRLPIMDSPFHVALPDLISFNPDRPRSSVVLPAPFAPITAASFPVGTLNETELIARIAP